MTTVPDRDLLSLVKTAIDEAPTHAEALQAAVTVLKREVPDYSWVGIYLMEGDELVLGPFLGKPSPHTRIALDTGICGAAATEGRTIIVDDVAADPRYLACSLETRSEIVVPIIRSAEIVGEIDIDSDQPGAFDARDRALLEEVASALAARFPPA
ncbi:MAG: GAF domain-containing protein [Acidobacteriota bacterium]